MNAGTVDVDPVGLTSCGAVVWRTRGTLRVTAIVKATFTLVHGGPMTPCPPAPLATKDHHLDKNPARSLAAGSDLAPHLPRADVTFVGHAYAPAGRAVPASSVRVAVFRDRALLDKTLHVFGDRRPGGGPPAPFQRIPIVYERAARGGGDNPVGVPEGELPNIVDPRAPASPAGFGPVSRYWPPRRRILGGEDPGALEGAIVEIPEGFAWDWFQAAPPDQQIDHLRGDEWLVLDGLHPALPRLQTRLPGARGQAMVFTQGPQGYGPGYPIALEADTLAIDGDRMTASVVWRASLPVRDAATLGALRIFGGIALSGAPVPWPAPPSIAPRRPAESAPASLSGRMDLDWSAPASRREPPQDEPSADPGTVDGLTSAFAAAAASRPALPFQGGPPSRPGPEAHAPGPDLPGAPWSATAAAPPPADEGASETQMIDGASLSLQAEGEAPDEPEDATRTIDLASLEGPRAARTLPFAKARAGAAPPAAMPPSRPLEPEEAHDGETRMVDLAALRGEAGAPALPFAAPPPVPPPEPPPPSQSWASSQAEDGETRMVDLAALRGEAATLPFAASPPSVRHGAPSAPQATGGLPFAPRAAPPEVPPSSGIPLPSAAAPPPPAPSAPAPPSEAASAARWFHTPERGAGAAPPTGGGPPTIEPPRRRGAAIPIVNRTPLKVATLPWQVRPPQDSLTVLVKGTFDLVADAPATIREEALDPTGDLYVDDDETKSLRYASDFAVFKPKADVTLTGHAHAPKGSSPAAQVSFAFGAKGRGFRRAISVFGDRRWQKAVVAVAPTEPEPFASMPLTYERAFGGPRYDRNPAGVGHRGAAGDDGIARLPNLEDPAHLVRGPGDTPAPACFAPIAILWKERYARMGTYDRRWLEQRWPYFPEDFDWAFFQAAPAAQQLDYLTGDEPYELRGLHPQHPLLAGTLPGKRVRCFAHHTPEGGGGFREIVLRLDTAAFDADALAVNLVWRGVYDVGDEEAPEINAIFVTIEDLAAPPITLEEARDRYLAAVVPVEPVEESPQAETAPRNDAGPAAEADPEIAALDAMLAAREKAIADELRAAGVPERAGPADPPPAPDPEAIAATLRAGGASEEDVAAVLDALKPEPPGAPAEPPVDVRAAVVDRLAAGRPLDALELTGADLSDLDFGGRSLQGTDLRGARLCRCSFAGSDLGGALLGGADLTGARLDGAQLAGADLTGAVLERASLEGAALAGCDLSGVRAPRSVFRGAKGAGATFVEGSYEGATFDGADLPAADFSRATIEGASFKGARLPEVRLYDVKGTLVVFDDAKMTGARAEGASLSRSSLKAVDAEGSVWEGACLAESTFHGANLKGASLARSKCKAAVFATADLTEARMRRGDFTGASFVKANLMTANLERAVLASADLRGANLHAAETWRATLDGAKLDLAIVTQSKLAKRAK